MRTIILALLLTACAPVIPTPAPTPAAKAVMPSDEAVVVFAEEVITRVSTSGCVGYYGPVKVRVSTFGEILGVCQ